MLVRSVLLAILASLALANAYEGDGTGVQCCHCMPDQCLTGCIPAARDLPGCCCPLGRSRHWAGAPAWRHTFSACSAAVSARRNHCFIICCCAALPNCTAAAAYSAAYDKDAVSREEQCKNWMLHSLSLMQNLAHERRAETVGGRAATRWWRHSRC